MDIKKSIEVLNTLIEINNDRIEGYLTASKETKESDLITFFGRFAETSQENRVDLVTEVRKLGGSPDESTLTSGKLYRIWMDLKSAVTGGDRHEILNSCEFGEEAALKAYTHAINNHSEDLTSEQLALLKAQQSRIKLDENQIKHMLDLVLEAK